MLNINVTTTVMLVMSRVKTERNNYGVSAYKKEIMAHYSVALEGDEVLKGAPIRRIFTVEEELEMLSHFNLNECFSRVF